MHAPGPAFVSAKFAACADDRPTSFLRRANGLRPMWTPLLVSTVRLRHAFRRHAGLALCESLAAVGLLPMLATVPRDGWTRLLLVLLLAGYGLRRARLARRAHAAEGQLRLEEQFLRYAHDPVRLRHCLRQGDARWARSRILQAMRAGLARPLPPGALTDERRERLHQPYRHAFRRFDPGRPAFDLALLGALVVGVVAAPHVPFDPGSLLFQTGIAALLLALACGAAQLVQQARTTRHLALLASALAEWTLEGPAADDPAGPGYAHTLLYRSPPWFTPPPAPA